MKKKKMTPDDFYSIDSPPLTDEELSEMRPHKELFPDWPRFIRTHTTGDVEQWKRELTPRRPQKAPTKTKVTIRLSPRVVEHFKSQGKGWQTRVNEALLEYVNSRRHETA